MNTHGKLEQMMRDGEITEDEYKAKKAVYVEIILEMYIKDIITKEEMYERINQ